MTALGTASNGRGSLSRARIALPDGTSRPLADRITRDHVFYVAEDILPGDADISVAINRTIQKVKALGVIGAEVRVPRGFFTKTTLTSAIQLENNITLSGYGIGATTIEYDDTNMSGSNQLLRSGTSGLPKNNIEICGISFKGKLDTNPTSRYHLTSMDYVTNYYVHDCEFSYARIFSLLAYGCSGVRIQNNVIKYGYADGIAAWNCPDAFIVGNTVHDCADDAISAHTDDAYAGLARSTVVINGNNVWACNGIKSLGMKRGMICNNTLSRVHSYGIYVGSDSFFGQGNTPEFAIEVANNNITDVLYHPLAANGLHSYIIYTGVARYANGLDAAPGWNDVSDGSIQTLFGTGIGYFYNNNVDSVNTRPSPGDWFVNVHDNTCMRTLPAATNYSDWGYGKLWLRGELDPAVTDANLRPVIGLRFDEGGHHAHFQDNKIHHTVTAVRFKAGNLTTPVDNAFWRVCLVENDLADFTTKGVDWENTTPTSQQDITIERNVFDGDPEHKSGARNANGGWASATDPTAIDLRLLKGATVRSNKISNVGRDIIETTAGDNWLEDNIIYGQMVTQGFSTANLGVGQVHSLNKCIVVGANPSKSLFRKMIWAPSKALVENEITNNTGAGAAIGTPGTPPTGWALGGAGGITPAISDLESTGGINWTEINVNGSASGAGDLAFFFEPASTIDAAEEQVWCGSFWIATVGSVTNITSFGHNIYELDGSLSFLRNNTNNIMSSVTSTLKRFPFAFKVGASTAKLRPGLVARITAAGTTAFKIRIGLPALNRGPNPNPPIKTSGVRVVRSIGSAYDELQDLHTSP